MNKLMQYLVDNNLMRDNLMEQFNRYYDILIDWDSSRSNLTAITERGEVEVKHFIDSLLGHKYIKPSSTVVDIGAGAGFPALPLALVMPTVQFDMVDSLNKRVVFLHHAIAELNITNASAHHSRAEDFVSGRRERYDYAVARAVAPLPTLLEYLAPYVKVGGQIIAYKGDNYLPELEQSSYAMYMLGCELSAVDSYSLDNEYSRNIIIINKVKPTDMVFPRIGNRPRIQPIIK